MRKTCVIANPEKLAGHAILNCKPQTERQEKMQNGLKKAIYELNLPAVRVLWVDPAEVNGQLVFELGNEPAVNHTYPWWKWMAENYDRDKHSRLCTDLYWYVILGMQADYLIKTKNYTAEAALYAVCDGNRDLSVPMLRTFKLLETWDGAKPLLAGGHCTFAMEKYPLAYLKRIYNMERTFSHAVGLIIMDV